MPLTPKGKQILADMIETYGSVKKGKEVFYSAINAQKKGSKSWHKKRKT